MDIRDDKLYSLSNLSEHRRKYEEIVQTTMYSICSQLDALIMFQAEPKKVYAIVFSNVQKDFIFCSNDSIDAELGKYIQDANPMDLTEFSFNFDQNEVKKIFRTDIYEWMKKVYPRCSFTLTEEIFPNLKDYGTACIYRYVLQD